MVSNDDPLGIDGDNGESVSNQRGASRGAEDWPESPCGPGGAVQGVGSKIESLYSHYQTGRISVEELSNRITQASGCDWISDLSELAPDPEFLSGYPLRLARQFSVLGFRDPDNRSLLLVVGSGAGYRQRDMIARWFQRAVRVAFTGPETITDALHSVYEQRPSLTDATIQQLNSDETDSLRIESSVGEDLLETTGHSPIIGLVNSMLLDAVRDGASDIHLQPCEG